MRYYAYNHKDKEEEREGEGEGEGGDSVDNRRPDVTSGEARLLRRHTTVDRLYRHIEEEEFDVDL